MKLTLTKAEARIILLEWAREQCSCHEFDDLIFHMSAATHDGAVFVEIMSPDLTAEDV